MKKSDDTTLSRGVIAYFEYRINSRTVEGRDVKLNEEERIELALLKQTVASIKEDVAEMKQAMERFLTRLEQGYAKKDDYTRMEKRLEMMENRFWALVVSVLMLLAKTAFDLIAR